VKDEKTKIHSESTASSKADLICYLKKQDIAVPPRTEGRTSQQCERWGGFRLLATLAKGDFFSYPLKLVHQDKPDFLICYGECKVGIEFTEAISQEWAETDALMEREGIEVPLLMDQFKRGTPKRTVSQRRDIIHNQPVGEGWAGNGFAHEWALCMMDSVYKKTEDFRKPDFKKYAKNMLLIYDNWYIPPVNAGMKFLIAELKSYWNQKNNYDGVLIDTGNQLVTIYPRKWNQQPIVDLWA
jgi:hypothetical protein